MITKSNKFRIASLFAGAVLFLSILMQCFFPLTKASAETADISGIAGLQLQLDAQSLSGISDGGKIARLSNNAESSTLEGVGDAVQADTTRQPTYVAESSINGKPAIRMDAQSFMQVGANTGFYLNDMTIFMVANFDAIPSSGNYDVFSRLNNASPWNHNWYFNLENGGFNYGWFTGSSHAQNRTVISKDTTYVLGARKSGTSGTLYVNGISAATFTGGGPQDDLNVPVYLGGTGGISAAGDIGELLVFDRGLSDAEVVQVEQYLEAKWGMEGIHTAQLSDLKINGESVVGFRADKYNYAYLSEEELKSDDITFALWNADDTASISEQDGAFEIKVQSGATTKIYRIEEDYMRYDYNEIQQLSANEVTLNDGFWGDRYRQYSTVTLNHMFDMFDLSNSFDNFDRVAAGEKKILGNTSEHAGLVRRPDNDRDVYNTTWTWIEEPWREGLIYEGIRAAGEFVMVNHTDPAYKYDVAEMITRIDGYIDRIYAAALQTTWDNENGKPVDGFFSTYNILVKTNVLDETDVTARWHHNIYVFGCLTEAATYWYNATGDTRLLFAATRYAEFLIDYIEGRDGFEGYKVVPAHELAEEALQNMYDLYNNNPDLVQLMEEKYSHAEGLDPSDRYYDLEIRYEKYDDIARSWITDRGNSEGRYNETNFSVYAQDNVTYDQATEAVGHAVRANLWYNGMAYIGNRQEEFGFVQAAYRIWNNIVDSQMYVTGGTGSTNDGDEAYGGSNQLPHDGYCETCASVGMAFFSQNMFNLFGEAKYADNVELEMYNGILGCLSLEGNSFYYTNPMVSDDYTRPMFSNVTPCCVPMFLKYYSELPEIIYAKTDSLLFVNQYIASSAQTKVGENAVTIVQDTDMPNGDSAVFSVKTAGSITLKLRMPSWASDFTLNVNGNAVQATVGDDGYIDVAITGGTTTVEIQFSKEVLRIHQDYAESNQGMVSFQYGPFVYCAEEVDNTVSGVGNILKDNAVSVAADAKVDVVYDDTTFELTLTGGEKLGVGMNMLIIEATAGNKDVELVMIPFCLRGNREPGEMDVWIKELPDA